MKAYRAQNFELPEGAPFLSAEEKRSVPLLTAWWQSLKEFLSYS